jgi:integrase
MARRFQVGSVQLHRLKNGTEIWQGRFWDDVPMPDGSVRRVRRKVALGSKQELRSERLARRALQPFVDRANTNYVPVEQQTANPVPSNSPNPKVMTSFEAFADKWEREVLIHSKHSTRETARSHLSKWLSPAFGKTPLGDIRGEAVQLFFNSMKGKTSAKTTRNVRNTLASILGQAHAWEYISHDPLAGLRLPKYKPAKKRAYTVEQVGKIIANSPARYQRLFYFLSETGVRAGEAAIEIPDIDLANQTITVCRAIWRGHMDTPKTDAGIRTFHISIRLTKLLTEEIGERTSGPVFVSRTGKPLDMHNVRLRALAKAREAAGLDYGDVHTFRHFNATVMDSLNVPMAVRRMRLGHAGASVTDGYTDAIEKDDKSAADKIAALISSHLDPNWTLGGSTQTKGHLGAR